MRLSELPRRVRMDAVLYPTEEGTHVLLQLTVEFRSSSEFLESCQLAI
jgi:hypothetical protein